MAIGRGALLASLLLIIEPCHAASPAGGPDGARLAQAVDRTEAVRAVKDLQRSYAQFAQFGLADAMAGLFASDATLAWGSQVVRGRSAIAAWLATRLGGAGRDRGALHTELIEDALVNLSPDGRSAKGRWMGMTFAGDGKGRAWVEGGIYENEFARVGDAWKLSALRYHPAFKGPFETGWHNVGGTELARVPFHFKPDQTGVPIPPATGRLAHTGVSLDALEARIDRLNDEDAVRNLQNAYGYYLDRKMWDDAVDLFAADCAVEIAGQGVERGPAGVRRALERMGPAGLVHGELNDRPLFDTIVSVLPGGREAIARGIELGLLGQADKGTASWSFAVFRNRFVKEDGLWKLKEVRTYPLLVADHAVGWGKGGRERPAEGLLPAFLVPVTRPGLAVAGVEPLTGAVAAAPSPTRAASPAARLLDAARRLARSQAFDGVENVSAAYGYYLDDSQWAEMASLFAERGNKQSPFAGFYLGRDRITAAATAMYGKPPATRPSIAYHWRIQPVITVSHDGRSANLRTRLFEPLTSTGARRAGGAFGFTGPLYEGMYPNDQAVLEKGAWKLWSLTIDEPYMTTNDWRGGWSAVEPVTGGPSQVSPLVKRLPPDILMTALGRRMEHFRGGTGTTINWPGILPMWFNYKNPVSGRVPPNYWPDSVPSLLLPQSRLIANGYQMPPTGPSIDGLAIELTPPETAAMATDGNARP